MKKQNNYPISWRIRAMYKTATLTVVAFIFAIGLSYAQDYCEPNTSNMFNSDYVSQVSSSGAIGDLDYSETSNPGEDLIDETDSYLTAYPGQEVEITTAYIGGSQTIGVWVDWNENGEFGDNDPDERLFLNNDSSPQSFTTTIPSDIDVGEYRMRVRGAWDSTGNIVNEGDDFACNTQSYGTTVDFTLKVIEAPSCFNPDNLVVNQITTNSAEIEWTPGDEEENWDIYFTETGENVPDENTTPSEENISNTSYELENLEENISYDVYVRAVCEENDMSDWAGPLSFSTACEATDVPFTQNFEDSDEIPNCGLVENVGNGNNWKVKSSSTSGFDGNVLNYSWHGTASADVWYFTQGINLEADEEYVISYKYSNNSITFTEKMIVAYGTAAQASEMDNELADHDAIQTTTPIEEEITFSVDTDGVYYFGFQAYSSPDQNQLYLDDIHIDIAPTCAKPNDLAIDEEDITDESVIVTWDGNDAEEWEVAYGEDLEEEDIDETETVDEEEIELTDLEENTTYNVYVRTVCEDNDTSPWRSISFTTLITPPANNDPEDAIALECDDSYEGSTADASGAMGATQDCASFSSGYSKDVWFSFEADGITEYTILGEGFDGVIEVYSGDPSDTDTFESVGCVDDIGQSDEITLDNLEEGTYYIRYFAYSTFNAGEYTMSLSCFTPELCDEVDAGTIILDEESVCPETSFTLTVEDSTMEDEDLAGLTGQWQVLDEDDWIDIEDANDTTYTVSDGITEATSYRFVLSCSEGNEDISNEVEIGINENIIDCRCIPHFSSTTDYIDSFELEDISNLNSGYSDEGYGDFTDMSTELEEEETYTATITSSSGSGSHGLALWIDYNDDGEFDTDEMIISESGITANETVEVTFTIPEDVAGEHILRVIYQYNVSGENIDPCASASYGEAEDYTINIIPNESSIEDCETPEDLAVDDITEDSAFVIWEPGMDPDATNGWEVIYGTEDFDIDEEGTNITVNDAPFVELEDLDAGTSYDVYVRTICDDDEYSDWTGPETFTTEEGDSEEGYCEGDYFDEDGDGGIGSFSTSGGEENIENNNISDHMGYHDFTDMIVSQAAGEDFSFTVDVASGFILDDAVVAIYIDYNNDYEFDSSEQVYLSFGWVPNDSGTITIPADTEPGNYRLRVVSDWDDVLNACDVSGSIHDYTLTVLEGEEPIEDCEAPENIAIDDITENTASINWDSNGANEWEVIYGAEGFDLDEEGTNITVNDASFVELEDLDADTSYDVYVRTICDDDEYSDWTGPETFTTEGESSEDCEAPSDINISEISDTEATVTWTPNGDEDMWAVLYGEAGFEPDPSDFDLAFEPSYELTDLIPETDYDIYVVAVCDASDPDNPVISDLEGPETFTTEEMSTDSHLFESFSYYPNPVENQLNLKAGAQIEQVQVFNLLGQKVIDVKPNVLETQINTQALQSGVYLMKVNIEGNQKAFRIVKK